MKSILFLFILCGVAGAQDLNSILDPMSCIGKPSKPVENKPASTSTALDAATKMGLLDIKTDAYGLGVHSDQFGRPTRYEVIGQPKANADLLNVKPNAYGFGVGADQFGRPVKAKTAW